MIPSNAAHWHLILNHLPIVGILFATMALVLSAFTSKIAAKRLALGLVVMAALFSVPAFLTGEPAEEIVEKFEGISENLIEAHEEAAEAGFIAILIAGALALGTLGWSIKRENLPKFLTGAVLVASLVSLVFLGRAANLGGEIRHAEISNSSAPSLPPPPLNEDAD